MRFVKEISFILTLAVGIPAYSQIPKYDRLPNIVLVTIDTLRSDHLSCYGYQRKTTPMIDKLAADGVLFQDCTSAASWTLPSYTSIFTGVYPCVHDCTASNHILPKSIPTFPEGLKAKGYYCAAVVSNPYLGAKFGFGRGFDKYDDYSVFLDAELGVLSIDSNPDHGIVNEIVTGSKVTHQAILLLEQAKKSGKPIFLFIHYFDPHDSYIPPAPYNTEYDPKYQGQVTGRGVEKLRANPPEKKDLQHLIALYDGEIRYNDQQVGELLKKVDEISDPAHTIIIFVSDHGEAFGEHGLLLHGNNPYREEVSVPMIWRWIGVLPKGKRVKEPVMNFDIAKTLGELFGFKNLDLMQDKSLWAGLIGKELPVDRIIFSDRANREPFQVALTEGRYRFHTKFKNEFDIHEGEYELYDLSSDPMEQKNLISSNFPLSTQMEITIEKIWAEGLEMRKYYQEMDEKGKPDLTEAERNRLKSLGYIGGGGVK